MVTGQIGCQVIKSSFLFFAYFSSFSTFTDHLNITTSSFFKTKHENVFLSQVFLECFCLLTEYCCGTANHDSTTVVASLLTIVFCLAGGKKKQKERKGIGRLLVVRKQMFIC